MRRPMVFEISSDFCYIDLYIIYVPQGQNHYNSKDFILTKCLSLHLKDVPWQALMSVVYEKKKCLPYNLCPAEVGPLAMGPLRTPFWTNLYHCEISMYSGWSFTSRSSRLSCYCGYMKTPPSGGANYDPQGLSFAKFHHVLWLLMCQI